MSERVVIYTRVSSEEQISGTSLETQERVCRDHAARNGWAIDRLFTDAGESAKTDDRAQFQAMISYCSSRARRISRIVVFKLDRFARDADDFGHYRRGLRISSGTSIVSATESITDDPSGRLLGTMLAGVAQFDNQVRAERTVRSMRQLQQAGYWTHQPPLGYVTARRDGKPILEAQPIAGPALADVFNRVAAGALSPGSAVRVLAVAGVRSRSGKEVTLARVHEILRDPIYCGRIETKWTAGRSVKAAFASLVSEDVFDRVQLVLSGRGRSAPSRPAPPPFPLRGFVHCAACDTPMTAAFSTGRNGARFPYYECHHRCPGSRGRQELLERQWLEQLAEVKSSYSPLLRLFRAVVCDVVGREHAADDARRAYAVGQVEKAERRAAKLLDAYLDGTISEPVFKARNDQLQIELAEARVAARAGAAPIDMTATLKAADAVLADPAGLWLRLAPADRQRFEVALFRDGLTWSASAGLRNRGSGCVYELLRDQCFDQSEVAPPSGATSKLHQIIAAFAPLVEVAAA